MNEKRQDGEKRVRGKWGGMEERVQIIEERREASVDSFDRKPQLLAEKYYTHTHTHTQLLEIYPLTLNGRGSRRCSCVAPRPSSTLCVFVCVSSCFVLLKLCCLLWSFAEHCAHLILALGETIEYCQNSWGGGGGRGFGRMRAFLRLSPSRLCARGRGCFDLILT